MKVKIIERFNDKNTKEFYKLNEEIEVPQERCEEIKNFVEIIEENKNNKTFEESVKKSSRRER